MCHTNPAVARRQPDCRIDERDIAWRGPPDALTDAVKQEQIQCLRHADDCRDAPIVRQCQAREQREREREK